MKRHVAATLLGVLGLLIMDSHVDWVHHDNGILVEVSGQAFDPQGWVAEQWRQVRKDCRLVHSEPTDSTTAQSVLQVIQQHSLPDSLESQLRQLHLQSGWGLAEVEFKTLNPSIVVLRQVEGHWQIQETAVWSGSTSPWLAADFVRRYLRQQAPQLQQALLDCMPIEASRYAAVTPRPKA